MEYLNTIFLRQIGTMTNRRVHQTSINDLEKNYVRFLSNPNSFLFCHIINSLERFILFKGSPATVNISKSLPKESAALLFHSPKQTNRSIHECFLSKTTFKFLTQSLVAYNTVTLGLLKNAGKSCLLE